MRRLGASKASTPSPTTWINDRRQERETYVLCQHLRPGERTDYRRSTTRQHRRAWTLWPAVKIVPTTTTVRSVPATTRKGAPFLARNQGHWNQQGQTATQDARTGNTNWTCKYCALAHFNDARQCRAKGVTCYSCGKVGHLSRVCMSSKYEQKS